MWHFPVANTNLLKLGTYLICIYQQNKRAAFHSLVVPAIKLRVGRIKEEFLIRPAPEQGQI